jgi:signal transduction histidine kinase
LLAVWPGAGNCQEQQLLNWKLVPVPGVQFTFQALVTVTVSGKFSVTVQPLKAVVPVLVTLTSTWKKVPPVFEGVAVQLCAAYACPFENRPSARLDSSIAVLIKTLIVNPP